MCLTFEIIAVWCMSRGFVFSDEWPMLLPHLSCAHKVSQYNGITGLYGWAGDGFGTKLIVNDQTMRHPCAFTG